MGITNSQSGTNVHEVADGIYRINTPVKIPGAGGFSFNQYLIVDDEPLLFHTGLRKMFPLVREAVASVMPVETPALHRVLARGGRRVRLAQRVAGRRAAGRAAVRHGGGHGLDRRPGGPAAARAGRRRGAVAGQAPPCAGSTRRTCRTRGSAAS